MYPALCLIDAAVDILCIMTVAVTMSQYIYVMHIADKQNGSGVVSLTVFFMAALCNRAGHIYFHSVVSSSSSIFPRQISAVGDWMSTILPHMVWP